MPEYLTPGTYIEEISRGSHPIEGVSTSIAGFVGLTQRGPQHVCSVDSWGTYQKWYGSHIGPGQSFLSYAVQGFFENGGQRCVVGRVVHQTAKHASLKINNLTISAVGAGDWGNGIYVRILHATKQKSEFKDAAEENSVRVQVVWFRTPPSGAFVDFTEAETVVAPNRRKPDVIEEYDNLSLNPKSPNYLIGTINRESTLIRLSFDGAPQSLPECEIQTLKSGTEGDIDLDAYEGHVHEINGDENLFGRGTGLAALERMNEVSILMAPDHVHPSSRAYREALSETLVAQCRRRQDRFAILSTPRDIDVSEAKPAMDTSRAAQFYPWIRIYDTDTRDDIIVPATGHIAGVFARTDLERGVHKSPANSLLIGALELDKPVSKSLQDQLDPAGINCILDLRAEGRGIRLWEGRTMSSDPDWKYVTVRRLLLFIEESVAKGTQWVVFEPNSRTTWSNMILTVTEFLDKLWKRGALMGATPGEAFFVKCGRETMSEKDIQNGRLICEIGIAPVKPAEFVIFQLVQKTTQVAE